MMDCDACQREAATEPIPRWKAPLLFVGAVLFCPCHLPATFAVVAALGATLTGAAWFFQNKVLVYSLFSLVYVAILVLLYQWFSRSRDHEARLEELHLRHAAQG